VIANKSAEAPVRIARCPGSDVFLMEDPCCTFAREDWNGWLWSAGDVCASSLASLDRGYCTGIRAEEALEGQA
jgi:hypothetical protein